MVQSLIKKYQTATTICIFFLVLSFTVFFDQQSLITFHITIDHLLEYLVELGAPRRIIFDAPIIIKTILLITLISSLTSLSLYKKSSRYLASNFLLITILGLVILHPVSFIKAILSLIFNNFLLFITTGLVCIGIYHYKKASFGKYITMGITIYIILLVLYLARVGIALLLWATLCQLSWIPASSCRLF